MLGKVEICGVNTTKLPTLTAAETDALLHRAKDGDAAARTAWEGRSESVRTT